MFHFSCFRKQKQSERRMRQNCIQMYASVAFFFFLTLPKNICKMGDEIPLSLPCYRHDRRRRLSQVLRENVHLLAFQTKTGK